MVNKKKFKGFGFKHFFSELYAVAPSPFENDSQVVVHFIGDPLDREFFVKDVMRLNNATKDVLIRVGV